MPGGPTVPHHISKAICLAVSVACLTGFSLAGCGFSEPFGPFEEDEGEDGRSSDYTIEFRYDQRPAATGSMVGVQLGPLYSQSHDLQSSTHDFVIMGATSYNPQVMAPRTAFEEQETAYQRLEIDALAAGTADVEVTVRHDDRPRYDYTFGFEVVDPARVEVDFGCPDSTATPTASPSPKSGETSAAPASFARSTSPATSRSQAPRSASSRRATPTRSRAASSPPTSARSPTASANSAA